MVQILDSFQNLQQLISSINIANFWELSKEYKLLNLIAVFAYRSQRSYSRSWDLASFLLVFRKGRIAYIRSASVWLAAPYVTHSG